MNITWNEASLASSLFSMETMPVKLDRSGLVASLTNTSSVCTSPFLYLAAQMIG